MPIKPPRRPSPEPPRRQEPPPYRVTNECNLYIPLYSDLPNYYQDYVEPLIGKQSYLFGTKLYSDLTPTETVNGNRYFRLIPYNNDYTVITNVSIILPKLRLSVGNCGVSHLFGDDFSILFKIIFPDKDELIEANDWGGWDNEQAPKNNEDGIFYLHHRFAICNPNPENPTLQVEWIDNYPNNLMCQIPNFNFEFNKEYEVTVSWSHKFISENGVPVRFFIDGVKYTPTTCYSYGTPVTVSGYKYVPMNTPTTCYFGYYGKYGVYVPSTEITTIIPKTSYIYLRDILFLNKSIESGSESDYYHNVYINELNSNRQLNPKLFA